MALLFSKFMSLSLPTLLFLFFSFFYILNKDGSVYLQITYTVTVPEIAFTGDTMSDFIVDQNNIDALRSRILVMEVHLL